MKRKDVIEWTKMLIPALMGISLVLFMYLGGIEWLGKKMTVEQTTNLVYSTIGLLFLAAIIFFIVVGIKGWKHSKVCKAWRTTLAVEDDVVLQVNPNSNEKGWVHSIDGDYVVIKLKVHKKRLIKP